MHPRRPPGRSAALSHNISLFNYTISRKYQQLKTIFVVLEILFTVFGLVKHPEQLKMRPVFMRVPEVGEHR